MTEYLIVNAIELVILLAAIRYSESKALPFYLAGYSCMMSTQFIYNQKFIEVMSRVGVDWRTYNLELAEMFFHEAILMYMAAAILLFNLSRMAMLTLVIIAIQGMLSFVMCGILLIYVYFNVDFLLLMEAHYSMQGLFVILYCVIAWMCVYYSRAGIK